VGGKKVRKKVIYDDKTKREINMLKKNRYDLNNIVANIQSVDNFTDQSDCC
jgi:hypothetical protein